MQHGMQSIDFEQTPEMSDTELSMLLKCFDRLLEVIPGNNIIGMADDEPAEIIIRKKGLMTQSVKITIVFAIEEELDTDIALDRRGNTWQPAEAE